MEVADLLFVPPASFALAALAVTPSPPAAAALSPTHLAVSLRKLCLLLNSLQGYKLDEAVIAMQLRARNIQVARDGKTFEIDSSSKLLSHAPENWLYIVPSQLLLAASIRIHIHTYFFIQRKNCLGTPQINLCAICCRQHRIFISPNQESLRSSHFCNPNLFHWRHRSSPIKYPTGSGSPRNTSTHHRLQYQRHQFCRAHAKS
jgi:hypothetical protein